MTESDVIGILRQKETFNQIVLPHKIHMGFVFRNFCAKVLGCFNKNIRSFVALVCGNLEKNFRFLKSGQTSSTPKGFVDVKENYQTEPVTQITGTRFISMNP